MSKTSNILKHMRERAPRVSPIAKDMVLPNHSGRHSAAKYALSDDSVLFIENNKLSEDNANFYYDSDTSRLSVGQAGKIALTDDLVAYWKLDDNADSTAVTDSWSTQHGVFTDPTGNANTSAHTSSEAIIETALSFDGTDDYVLVSADSAFEILQDVSMSFWFKPTAQPATTLELVGRRDLGSEKTFDVTCRKLGSGVALNWAVLTTTSTTQLSSQELPLNTWTHVVVTWDSADARIYINGVLYDSITKTGSMEANAAKKFRIGGTTSFGGRYLTGLIDEVALWSRAIDADVSNLYNDGLGFALPFNGANVTPTAKLYVDQDINTEGIPVITLDQADLSEEMIHFETTIGTGNPVEAVASKVLTTTHFIKITLPGGLVRYIPCGTIA